MTSRRRPERRVDPRSGLVALASTIGVFGLLGYVIVNSPGWPEVRASFFNAEIFQESWPAIVTAFWVNIRMFLIVEVLVLGFALLLAVMRGLPGPVLFPFRVISTVYVDIFRALPGILVIFMLGFGVPALELPGVPSDPFFWGVVTLTLLYSAYVSEVYRSGIESIHPSQAAAARSLGLSHLQALRFVVIPQAVRRVIPPLLNDFIGLQKDTVLVSFLGVVEIFRTAQIKSAATFNFTPYVVVALVFIVVTIPLARLVDWLVARQGRDRAPIVRGGSGIPGSQL